MPGAHYSKLKSEKLNIQIRSSTITAERALKLMPKKNRFVALGKYSISCPLWFTKRFKKINRRQLYSWFLAEAFGLVLAELDRKKYKVISTRNWRRSRFTPAKDILKKRLRTCGTMALLTAAGLRSLGIPVKLIHGYFKDPKEKFRHAWNEVYFPDAKKFLPLDITRLNYAITDQHIKIKECVDWEELEGKEWDVAKKYKKVK